MNNIICAPVIIPTLNRYKHLKKCIQSLKNNSLAKQTEVYISLDFPPHEKYQAGYDQVKKYLQGGITGFKEVYIFYQKTNLGPSENSSFLKKEIFKKYDRYIFTEDDNVFSQNYLEYMNLCLEKFKDDETIYAIGGYTIPIEWSDDSNMIIRQSLDFTAWGYGTWKKEYEKEKLFSRTDIYKYLNNFQNAKYLYRNQRNLFNHAVYIASGKHYLAILDNGELRHIDIVQGLYLFINKKYMIFPAISKVRNMGYDGSGQNCKIAKNHDDTVNWYEYEKQEMDLSAKFILDETKILDINQSHIKQLNHYFKVSHCTMIKTWIIWFLKIWLKKESDVIGNRE